ncbi:MAG: energy transducer TonB [Candidatus Paceibacterota bacterium]|jgi:TonB family protein|nr:energy transducer TonB [Candidatus Paceibacterota bacterium]
MSFFKKTEKNAAKQFRLSFVLSISFHALIFSFFIFFSPIHREIAAPENFVIQARLVEEPKKIILSSNSFSEEKTSSLTQEIPPVNRPVLTSPKNKFKLAVPAVRAAHISRENLQNDIRSLAENIAFPHQEIDPVHASSTSVSHIYRSYVDRCRQKIAKTGNRSNRASEDGTVILHLTISGDGKVVEKSADSFESSDLENAAFQIIAEASPFDPFPEALGAGTIKIAIPIHFAQNSN